MAGWPRESLVESPRRFRRLRTALLFRSFIGAQLLPRTTGASNSLNSSQIRPIEPRKQEGVEFYACFPQSVFCCRRFHCPSHCRRAECRKAGIRDHANAERLFVQLEKRIAGLHRKHQQCGETSAARGDGDFYPNCQGGGAGGSPGCSSASQRSSRQTSVNMLLRNVNHSSRICMTAIRPDCALSTFDQP